ncbi:hypothetical protein TRFO_27140 [Tritrichomonas foetus]|uniref:Uncharacterized protein n=1 Tax=Tritrichomonas foetus TaxID=1144522 RepID=A0A1J4K1T9_9EUKA|nr:hypothetical protein TRFO_27140 [Tritrichomonas foetus]|eukprot:OHT05203.1 hypothetical protein TRFO_27140 [Tritrichomonas foetus]
MNWKPEEEPAPVEPREDIYMPSQEMMDEGIELAMEGKDLGTIDLRLLQLLIAPLREIRLTALQNDDYKLAQKAEQGTRNVVAQQTLQLKIEEQDEKMSEQQQRLEIAQIQLENVKEKWDILIEQRKQQMEEDLQNRQAEFLVSLEEFDQQFQKEPPPKVLKLSPTALDLKAKERFLVSSKRFDEAKKMRAMANLRERQEIKSKKEQYYKNLLKEREKLIEKEKQKEFVVEMNWQSNIIQMQMNANKEITHAQKTVDHLISLTKSLETESVMSKTARKLPPLNISKGNNISTMNTIR